VRHETNHQRLTPIGTLKRTWLSPDTCACVTDAPIPDVLLLATLEGFRDFHPALAAANLATHPRFAHCRILTGEIRLPQLAEFSRNPHEFRSADIARLCDKHHLVADLASEISRMVQESGVPDCRHIVLPACLSLGLVGPRLAELEQRTGCTIKEVATMPPSLIGMRMQEALKRRFMALGGTFLTSERVLGARYEGDRVVGVHTQNGDDQLFEADNFVLASGSFFSRGLESRLRGIREPIFDADVLSLEERDAWAGRRLFDTTPLWGSGSRPTTSSECCAAASRSPTSTAPAVSWPITTPLKRAQALALPLPPAGRLPAIFWARPNDYFVPYPVPSHPTGGELTCYWITPTKLSISASNAPSVPPTARWPRPTPPTPARNRRARMASGCGSRARSC